MPHLGEAPGRLRTDAARGRVLAHQRRKALLDRRVALAQRVVFGVRDRRRILLVITLVVPPDLGREPLELGFGLRLIQRIDGNLFGFGLGHQVLLSWGGEVPE